MLSVQSRIVLGYEKDEVMLDYSTESYMKRQYYQTLTLLFIIVDYCNIKPLWQIFLFQLSIFYKLIVYCIGKFRVNLMIKDFFLPKLEEKDMTNVWFHQDGATTLRLTRHDNLFERSISLRGDLEWPAGSSDLAPCDYFFWGYFKYFV